ncbi:MAG TPA: exodeoxyribonuclease VII small subunit [Candidatus Dormibacteraeota bacterium]|nr:exodeoxyribonuclease VII small subunit [Candidatus Dormibacteraeota bacterium]
MVKKFVYIERRNDLEKILNELQSPDLDLEEAVSKYKEGLSLVEEIEVYLNKTKNMIKELKK